MATQDSPFARAFFVMLEGLDILPSPDPGPPSRTRVCVVTPERSASRATG